jgi:class 3 adenylate cyclase
MLAALAFLGASLAAAAPRPLPALPAPGAVYERRGVGLVVLDIKGSTPLYLAESNKRAHAMIMGVLDRAEAVAAESGGVVIRRLGDGQLLAFPSLEQALEAVGRIQGSVHAWRRGQSDAPLKLRASVVQGRVLFDGDRQGPEVYGQNVERALRLASLGDGGDIAVDAALAAHPAVQKLAAQTQTAPRGEALLLKPLSQTNARPAPMQPPLSVTRPAVAATLFATLADWGGAYDAHGRRSAFATVKAFHEHVLRAVELLGGFVAKTQGEVIMASFSSPAAALAAASRIQRLMEEVRQAAPLGALARAKIGLTYGRLLREDRLDGTDFYGNRVNAAARLMHLAAPGEVLASGSLLEQPASAAILKDAARETLSLKGFGQPILALRLKPRAARPRAAAVRHLRELAQRARARVVRVP